MTLKWYYISTCFLEHISAITPNWREFQNSVAVLFVLLHYPTLANNHFLTLIILKLVICLVSIQRSNKVIVLRAKYVV